MAITTSALAQTPTLDGEARSVKTQTEAQIAHEFVAICVAGYPSMADVTVAVDSSEVSYIEISDESVSDVRRDWESEYGWMGFLSGSPKFPDITPQCDFSGFTQNAASPELLRAALITELSEKFADSQLVASEKGISLSLGNVCALVRHHKRASENHVTLIIQPAVEGACSK
ncbi:hypothetical protein K3179_10365 [Qipengyuania sp. GH38]|uniref:hypothetical protein n=1 Tax=Qipengyuania intermedia TaxID=2867244 RepID=UPI001C879BFD|nr:hypothetical protein [Qipengyuania intermedia]MBX7514944.1 hypothetical protein [Qipengyuania intermedia]